jgi:hypothetical protein
MNKEENMNGSFELISFTLTISGNDAEVTPNIKNTFKWLYETDKENYELVKNMMIDSINKADKFIKEHMEDKYE